MSISVGDLAMGMDVRDCNNEKIGVINEIINEQYRAENRPGADHLYVEVATGNMLAFWEKSLYVPASAITRVEPGHYVVIAADKEQAKERFATKPDNR